MGAYLDCRGREKRGRKGGDGKEIGEWLKKGRCREKRRRREKCKGRKGARNG